MKTRIVVILITLLCAAMASVHSARAAIITVTNTNDSGAGSLRQALADANDGDTIDFSVTTPGTITLTSGELLVNKNVTISGPGANHLSVNGNAASTVFHISPGKTVTISGLTITNANGYGRGWPGGGGIYNDHAMLTVNDSTISGNSGEYTGGGISNDADYGAATLTINNSTISGNSAPDGGGIYNLGSYGTATLTINESIIRDNSGGGVSNFGPSGSAPVTISNSMISGNSGDGITNYAAPMTITCSTISGNIGIGIFNVEGLGDLTIDNSTISCNIGDGLFNAGTLTANNSTFNDNGGSGLHSAGYTTVTIDNSAFSGNSGSGIYNTVATVTINNSTINGNSGTGIFGDDRGTVTINNSTISGNSGLFAGGVWNGGGLPGEESALTINNSTISGNSSVLGGGGGTTIARGLVTIKNSTLSGNSGADRGSISLNSESTLVIGHTILKASASAENIFTLAGGTVTSLGYNLSSDDASAFLNATGDQNNTDPMLGPLQNNGGPTFTHKLLAGSPAIDAGDPSFTSPPNYDQRGAGFPRVVNGRIDIGAFEVQSGPPPTPTPNPACAPPPIPMCTPTPTPNRPPVAVDDFYQVDELAALNEPAPGVLVNDSDPDAGDMLTAVLVTGPSHARSFQLNSNGSFTYVPAANYYGPDTFTYHTYDGRLYSETATVHITVRQPCSQGGFITGGGKFFQDGRKCTFGFVAKVQGNGVQGNLEFQDQNMRLDVKAGSLAWVYVPNEIDGYFSGACRVNNITGYTFFVQVHDRGQPGSNDDFSVWIYNSNNAQVYTSGSLLSGGNILIHHTADAVSPREWFCDNDGDGYRVSAGFSCTAPSPECSYDNVGLGADCDDNNPDVTVCSRHWWCDNDEDGFYMDYGFSSTAPFGNCIDYTPTYIDYCDTDPTSTAPCP